MDPKDGWIQGMDGSSVWILILIVYSTGINFVSIHTGACPLAHRELTGENRFQRLGVPSRRVYSRVHHANWQMIKMHDWKNGGVYFNRFFNFIFDFFINFWPWRLFDAAKWLWNVCLDILIPDTVVRLGDYQLLLIHQFCKPSFFCICTHGP